MASDKLPVISKVGIKCVCMQYCVLLLAIPSIWSDIFGRFVITSFDTKKPLYIFLTHMERLRKKHNHGSLKLKVSDTLWLFF